ncbi:MAG TPA: type III secretion system stator protein SctL [Pyrinomonadaceae bacterium]|jgi:type III secretion protein L|nr:type III secretion system stator protein SctL [Pyrinomonadaceae bacterium]
MSTQKNENVIKQPDVKARGAAEPSHAPRRGAVVKRAVAEARAEARRILAEAHHEAEELRERARHEARELREAAYEEGREAALEELNFLLLEAHERRDAALSGAERDVLRLAVKLAEKIIGREIERDDATLADIVSAALRHARQQEALTVRVNPADLPRVQAHRERLDPSGRARFIDLVADPRVGPGGCVIEGESGTVDARLDTQLRVLERALLARASAADT